jgi:Putative Flp pilus-assembly TadE/G-like
LSGRVLRQRVGSAGPTASRVQGGVGRRASGGQVIVIFALSLNVIVAAVGLVIDVGSAWAQQRNQQRAADLAVLAAATAEANGKLKDSIVQAARSSAATNGYTGAEVVVSIPPTQGRYGPGGSEYTPNDCSDPSQVPCWIEVSISRDHGNTFSRVIGLDRFGVSARAVAVGGIANAVVTAAGPIMFNIDALSRPDDDKQKPFCNVKQHQCPSEDGAPAGVPTTANQYNWTTFCATLDDKCNVNSAQASNLISGGTFNATVTLGMYLGPNNEGQHTDLCFDLMKAYPDGGDFGVAINDDDGNLVAFWVFHFDPTTTDCNDPAGPLLGGSFVDDVTSSLPLTIQGGGIPIATSGIHIAQIVE